MNLSYNTFMLFWDLKEFQNQSNSSGKKKQPGEEQNFSRKKKNRTISSHINRWGFAYITFWYRSASP